MIACSSEVFFRRGLLTTGCHQHFKPEKSGDNRLSPAKSLLTIGLLRVSEYSDTRGSEYKIEYEYSSLPKSLDRDFFFFFLPFFN